MGASLAWADALGAAGVLAAPLAGRLADRMDGARVRFAGIVLVIASFAVFARHLSAQTTFKQILAAVILPSCELDF